MSWNWSEISLWFVTSFLGAAIVKLIDLAEKRYSDRRMRIDSKVSILRSYIKEFGELVELYRFFAYASSKIVTDELGEFKRDATGKFVVESKILEPEPRFEDAIKTLKGADINAVITQKIAMIRMTSSEVLDIALELDPSGDLKKGFNDLYVKTIWSIEVILKDKNSQKPGEKFNEIIDALKDADEVRRNLRIKVQRFVK